MNIRKYELLEQIGEGGMGVVHKACDTELGRTVAIKAIHEDSVACIVSGYVAHEVIGPVRSLK